MRRGEENGPLLLALGACSLLAAGCLLLTAGACHGANEGACRRRRFRCFVRPSVRLLFVRSHSQFGPIRSQCTSTACLNYTTTIGQHSSCSREGWLSPVESRGAREKLNARGFSVLCGVGMFVNFGTKQPGHSLRETDGQRGPENLREAKAAAGQKSVRAERLQERIWCPCSCVHLLGFLYAACGALCVCCVRLCASAALYSERSAKTHTQTHAHCQGAREPHRRTDAQTGRQRLLSAAAGCFLSHSLEPKSTHRFGRICTTL